MPLAPHNSLVPPGGFHFIDETGPVPVRIEGSSHEDVQRNVLQYRLKNGLPPGDPQKEYVDRLCAAYPNFCYDSEPKPVAPMSLNLSTRVAAWIGQFYNERPESVPLSTAEARANICATCVKNEDFRQGGCGSCVDNVERLAFVWLHNRETSQQASLGGCRVLGQHNGVAVFAKLQPSADPTLPAHCWRRAAQ